MHKGNISRIAVSALVFCVSWPVWGQNEAVLLDRLASQDLRVREQAHEALVGKGPVVLGMLFERMGGENKTEDLWARRTAEQIVFRSTRPDAERERSESERALLRVVRGEYPPRVKDFAYRMISLVGKGSSVPVLAERMKVKPEREMARWALERIRDRKATRALIEALEQTDDPEWKMALVKTLGSRGDARARSAVLGALEDSNQQVRLTAIAAAGHLPHARTKAALWEIWQEGAKAEKKAAADALLRVAEGWLELGLNKAAGSVYRRFYQEAPSSHLRCAGLSGLAQAEGKKLLPVLLASLRDPDMNIRGVAQGYLLSMPGDDVTLALAEELKTAEGGRAVALVELIHRRGGPASVAALADLLRIVADTQAGPDLRRAAGMALARIPGEETTEAILTAARKSSTALRADWVRLLGERGDRGATRFVLRCASSEDRAVRIAALEAVGRLGDAAGESVLRSALTESDEGIKRAAVRSAVRVSIALERAGRKQEAVDLCVAAAQATNNPSRLRELADRLSALGATEYVAEMAQRSGFIVSWWVLGPVPDRGYLREHDILPTGQPVNLSESIKVKQREYSWKHVRVENPVGQLDLERAVARRDNVGAYLYAEFESEQARDAILKIGSDDDVFCWLNGNLVHKFTGDRGWTPDQDTAHVQLKRGRNWILMKVLNGGAQWAASLRITDSTGNPLVLPQKE